VDLISYLHPGWLPLIRPAEPTRNWMTAAPESFANCCLPLRQCPWLGDYGSASRTSEAQLKWNPNMPFPMTFRSPPNNLITVDVNAGPGEPSASVILREYDADDVLGRVTILHPNEARGVAYALIAAASHIEMYYPNVTPLAPP